MNKILIVDDSEFIRLSIRIMLEEMGFSVLEAGGGDEAMSVLGKNADVAAVMIDILMPGIDGFELLCKIREKKEYDAVKTIMVTTETEMEQVEKALKFGANEYIMKPVMKDIIQSKLTILGIIKES